MMTRRLSQSVSLAGVLSSVFALHCSSSHPGSDPESNQARIEPSGDAGVHAPSRGSGGIAPTGQAPEAGSGQGPGDGSDSGTGSGPGSQPDGGGTTPVRDAGAPSSAIGATFLSSLGKSHLLVGGSMQDSIATLAPFDARYIYLAGGLFDSPEACNSCTNNCSSGGTSCSTGSCGWWGCWQSVEAPPGQFATGFFGTAATDHQIPVISYYEILQASGASEGSGEVAAANDATFMTRYLADWRFLMQQVGASVVILHVEPDFWGYAEQVNEDPHATPAAVATANPSDCGSEENSIAGMARCMIAMARTYAPNAKVGLHASSWGTKAAALLNSDPTFDIAANAQQLGAFLVASGATDGDFIMADASDRDAGYYTSVGKNTWWDPTNATLPNFHQAFAWSKALAETMNLGVMWWQLPVGNMGLPNVTNQWNDNRVDYFLSHTDEVAAAHGVGMLFGAGDGSQTTPSTDNGNLVSKTQSYAAAGGQPL